MENNNPEIFESLTVKYGDIRISISSEPEGILENKNTDEILKYCADILLQLTDDESLENKIEIPLAIQETLDKDFGWDKNKIFDFLRKLKKRLYIMNIGEYVSKQEKSDIVKEIKAQEKYAELTESNTDINDVKVSAESNVVTIVPKQDNFSKEDLDYPVEFSDSSKNVPSKQKKKPFSNTNSLRGINE